MNNVGSAVLDFQGGRETVLGHHDVGQVVRRVEREEEAFVDKDYSPALEKESYLQSLDRLAEDYS